MEAVFSICTARGAVDLLGLRSNFFLLVLTSGSPSQVWNSDSALLCPHPWSKVFLDLHRGCSCPRALPWVYFHFPAAQWDCSCSHLQCFSISRVKEEGLEASCKSLGPPLARKTAFER